MCAEEEKAGWVSVHGGHSGEFCHHATDSLEAVLERYAELGFSWVGISEHVPAPSPEFRYPDQVAAGLTPEFLYDRFVRYMARCRELQAAFRPRLQVLVAMESESYSGYETFMKNLMLKFKPDYIVGSVHHVSDMGFDYSTEQYRETADAVGGMDAMYCSYFDLQLEMIETLRPSVVGHFDLIRIFDKDYRLRMLKPEIARRITRNLEAVARYGLILDFNLRALYKGGLEPYVSDSILHQAVEMGITLVPGDDSHGVSQVGNFMEKGIGILKRAGASTIWPLPRPIDFSLL
ncbi:histidinol-phosphatase [Desulfobotulus mexicanus]|uniref:Histidinol-phosphatase n=1 Tax=Desulfobotulus mexicanus TaxID=2586642 RepID=A0A5S5MCM6_9BACT|nr:histidinol-phosphatase [Desulfobotulus mexicanus]TYT73440.1 histidinol-phosphatase [Desulfobotulus mexicanus]